MHIPVCEPWGKGCLKGAPRVDVLWVCGIVIPSDMSHVTVCILMEDSGESILAQRSDSNGGILELAAG